MTGVDAARIAEVYPRLYHMAHIDSWPSISTHGLRSTNSLLDLYQIGGEERETLSQQHRPECVTIKHTTYGSAVIRDQKPMSDAGLRACLPDELTPTDWYDLLNQYVFFWPTEKRLHRMMRARAYKNDNHIVIVVDTTSMMNSHFDSVLLSRMNSGCTVPFPHARGPDTFQPPHLHPFEARKKSSGEGFAELLVEYAVPDIADHTTEVYVGSQNARIETIFESKR